ncbi:MAG: DUF3179 domain-containing protein [Halobacteriales archaeon]
MNVRSVIPRDAIPSIDAPTFGETHAGEPDDEVIVLEADPPRAYPLRILHYHEIVNDVVDGEPLAITWCPLCASAVVYERTLDGSTLTFGVSGKLADDDLVMYDRETESEWKQSLGTCIAGVLAGRALDARPCAITTWTRFRATHPEGIVLQPTEAESEVASDDDEPAPVDYDVEPYRAYFEADGFGLATHRDTGEGRSWPRDDLDPKAVVLGIERDGEAVGYPLPRVRAAGGVVTDTVGGEAIVVAATDDGIHAFAHPGWSFDLDDGALVADGTRWDAVTGASQDGRQLERLPAKRLFAFAWRDDHGDEAFFEG